MDNTEKKIVEYRMLSEYTANTLTMRVNHWIEQGFQPYGQPFYADDNKLFCQAMVKYRE